MPEVTPGVYSAPLRTRPSEGIRSAEVEQMSRGKARTGSAALFLALGLGAVLHGRGRTSTPSQNQNASESVRAVAYTDEQAARGMMLFRRNCMFCHSTNSENAKSPT